VASYLKWSTGRVGIGGGGRREQRHVGNGRVVQWLVAVTPVVKDVLFPVERRESLGENHLEEPAAEDRGRRHMAIGEFLIESLSQPGVVVLVVVEPGDVDREIGWDHALHSRCFGSDEEVALAVDDHLGSALNGAD